MGKYLDSGGLSHLIEKIKSWATGLFINRNGDTISANIKNKGNSKHFSVGNDNYEVALYMGDAGVNRGIYDIKKSKWMLYSDANYTYIDGHRVQSSVPANAVFTDTKYTAGTGLSLSGTAFSLADSAAVYEAYLKWGGKNFSGSYGCIDAAMISELGANRLALSKAAGISVEYSRDGGTTWTDYGLTDAQKTGLFGKGWSTKIGKYDSSEGVNVTTDWKVRVTLTTNLSGTYTVLNKFAFYVATNGATGCNVTITARTKANLDAGNNTWYTVADHVGVGGWSGWNIVNFPSGITTYGNNSGQYANIRFEFGIKRLTSDYSNAFTINRIMGFGGFGWSVPSYLAAHGHLYDYDSNQNAYFPGSILPTSNNAFNLGSSGSKWVNIYAARIYGDVQGGIQPTTNRPASANTTGYDAALRYFLATSAMTTGKPDGDGHILDMEWDNSSKWHGQLSVPTDSSKNVQWRTENGGTWTEWRKLFDDTDVIPAANGGTGETSLVNSANALMNALSTGSSNPLDADYYISQYAGGGTTTTTYHRRPMSALWNYIKGKIGAVLGRYISDGATPYRTIGTQMTVQTGSSQQQRISWEALYGWLFNVKKYFPKNVNCHVVGMTTWNYNGNDILQIAADNVNYEVQLAGVIFEVEGYVTGYNTGLYRFRIHTSPTTSFTTTSGYLQAPKASVIEYTCNGSGYNPVWHIQTNQSVQASTSAYGVTKLSSATNSSSEDLAATPKAVKAAYDLADSASTTAGQALSAATGAYAFKITYSVSGGNVVCAAHVYSAGSEVTSNRTDAEFAWSLSIDGGTSWTSLGTGKTKTVSALSAFGGNVKCDFTPAS